MRALSLCNLELYVRDTVFQASIYRSIHIAIHFCEDKSKDIYTLENYSEILMLLFIINKPTTLVHFMFKKNGQNVKNIFPELKEQVPPQMKI